MLIGDKGQSGGRRWEVSGFGLGPFSASPKVHRWVVSFVMTAFFTSPKVSRWVGVQICYGNISGPPRSVAGRCPDLPSGHFRTAPRSIAHGVAFWPRDILQQVTPLSFIRSLLCSTNGYCRLIILTSYLS